MLPYILGLGFVLFFLGGNYLHDLAVRKHSNRFLLLALLLVLGAELNYIIVLMVNKLSVSLIVGGALALTGFVMLALRCRGNITETFRPDWVSAAVFLYLLFLFGIPIVIDPIGAWDARSIWFFHGKMMFFNGSLDAGADWTRPAISSFSHTDYPNLLPVMASQIAYAIGCWNEYLPKLSLFVLLIPALLGLLYFVDGNWLSFIFLSVIFLLINGEHMWNGNMDGYLAIYAGLSTLYLSKWLEDNNGLHIAAGVIFLGIVLTIKNEGMLYSLVIAVCFSIFVFVNQNKHYLVNLVAQNILKSAGIIVVVLLAPMLWAIRKNAWGLVNDLQLGTGSFSKIAERLADGSCIKIAEHLVFNANVGRALILFVVVLLGAVFLKGRIPSAVYFCFSVALSYFVGIFAVYLSTPRDLEWHLSTSASRTMLPVLINLFAATYYLLRNIEKRN